MKILLIDDEPVELFISKKFLSMEFEVEGFNSVPEAIKWASTNTFDFLISDYYLDKNQTAVDVLNEIKKRTSTEFKSFVLTNHIDDDKKEMMISAGFSAVIEKPLSLEKFKKTIVL